MSEETTDYKAVSELGGVISTVKISYRFWAVDFDVGGAEDPAAAIRAAHAWFAPLVDELKGPFEVEEVKEQGKSEPSGSPEEMRILKYSLEEKSDGKYRLELYPDIKGSPGRWSDITFTADKKWMSDMLEPVIDDVGTAPCEGEVEWIAVWKQGRKKVKGEGHYRDLVALRQA
jgi:hypothetical protein